MKTVHQKFTEIFTYKTFVSEHFFISCKHQLTDQLVLISGITLETCLQTDYHRYGSSLRSNAQ